MALKYLNIDDNLTRILLVSKKWNSMLSRKIYKIYMMREIENKFLKKSRFLIWQNVLQIVLFFQLKIFIF